MSAEDRASAPRPPLALPAHAVTRENPATERARHYHARVSTTAPRTIGFDDGHVAKIRTADPDDAAPVLESCRRVLRELPAQNVVTLEEFTFTDEEERKLLQRYVDEPGWLFVVVEVDGRIVGQCNFRNGKRKAMQHSGNFGIHVEAKWRSRGIGTALIETLLAWAEDSPVIQRVELGVLSTNPRARSLYERLGFVVVGVRERAFLIAGEFVDDVLMARWIGDGPAPRS